MIDKLRNKSIAELEEVNNLSPSDEIPIFQTRLSYDYESGNTIVSQETNKTTLANLLNQVNTLQDGGVKVYSPNTNNAAYNPTTNTVNVDLPTSTLTEFTTKVAELDTLTHQYETAIFQAQGLVPTRITKNDFLGIVDMASSMYGGIQVKTSYRNPALVTIKLNDITEKRLSELEQLIQDFGGDLSQIKKAVESMQYNNNRSFLLDRFNYITNEVRFVSSIANHSLILLEINPNMIYLDGEESEGGVKYINCIKAKCINTRSFMSKASYGIAYNQMGISSVSLPTIKQQYIYSANDEKYINCLNMGTFSIPNNSSYYFVRNNSKLNPLNEFFGGNGIGNECFSVIVGCKVNQLKSYLKNIKQGDTKVNMFFLGSNSVNSNNYSDLSTINKYLALDCIAEFGMRLSLTLKMTDNVNLNKKLKLNFAMNTENNDEDLILIFTGFNKIGDVYISYCFYDSVNDKTTIEYVLAKNPVFTDKLSEAQKALDEFVKDGATLLSLLNTSDTDGNNMYYTHFGIMDRFITSVDEFKALIKSFFFKEV